MKFLDNYNQELKQLDNDKVSMYVCGPTVYNYIHIGNARPMIVFDVLYRLLQHVGKDVTYISNFTDIDDKIIKKAMDEKCSELDISEKYITEFKKDREALNILAPTHQPKVTECMDEIISFINDLVKTGFAYEIDGDVFFDTTSVEHYGKLSNKNIDDLQDSEAVINASKKKNPTDFALWKNTDVGVKWKSPWGEGRPGWHTECVVMINKIIGGKLDIHGGGVDLKFPHHENEIAQSIAHDEHNLADIWMHNGHISIDGEKMSKSLGNFILVRDILKTISANTLKVIMLKSSYKAPINFSEELIEDAKNELQKIERVLKDSSVLLQRNEVEIKKVNFVNKSIYMSEVTQALTSNLNTANAITEIFNIVKKLNAACRQKDLNEVSELRSALIIACSLLGLEFDEVIIKKEHIELFNKWDELKVEKNFKEADIIRDKLKEAGLI